MNFKLQMELLCSLEKVFNKYQITHTYQHIELMIWKNTLTRISQEVHQQTNWMNLNNAVLMMM